jgi:hypothetical protein
MKTLPILFSLLIAVFTFTSCKTAHQTAATEDPQTTVSEPVDVGPPPPRNEGFFELEVDGISSNRKVYELRLEEYDNLYHEKNTGQNLIEISDSYEKKVTIEIRFKGMEAGAHILPELTSGMGPRPSAFITLSVTEDGKTFQGSLGDGKLVLERFEVGSLAAGNFSGTLRSEAGFLRVQGNFSLPIVTK